MDSSAKVKMATIQLENMTMMFNKMMHGCWSKCVANLKEEELNVGEQSCTDRCIGKYIESSMLVQQMMQQKQMQMQQQQSSSGGGGWFS